MALMPTLYSHIFLFFLIVQYDFCKHEIRYHWVHVLQRNKWSGNGILSDILMHIRSKHDTSKDPVMDTENTAPPVGTTS